MRSQRSLQSLGAGATRSVGATPGDVRGTSAPRTVAARRPAVRLTVPARPEHVVEVGAAVGGADPEGGPVGLPRAVAA